MCLAALGGLVPGVLPKAWAAARGTASGEFLLILGNARPVALGEAYTALGWGDPAGLDYSPALIAGADRTEAAFTRLQFFAGASGNQIAVAVPRPEGAWGFSVLHFTPGSFERTNEIGVFTGEKLSANDLAFQAAYARNLGQNLTVGFGAKFVHRALDFAKANAGAIDLGFHYRGPLPGFSLGGSVQNFAGSRLQFIEAKENLPRTLRLGGAYRFPALGLRLGADAVKTSDDETRLHFGAEWGLAERFFVRGGYITREDKDEAEGLTAGLGYRGDYFGLDYAYQPFGFFGATHRFSIRAMFGAPPTRPRSPTALPPERHAPTPRARGTEARREATGRAPAPPPPPRVEGVRPKEVLRRK